MAAARLGPSIRALPGDFDARVKMVHCKKMLPMGIYGAEVSFMSDVALRSLAGPFLLPCAPGATWEPTPGCSSLSWPYGDGRWTRS